jgi:hypothetical protein
MSGAVEGVDINEVIRRVEYDMDHRRFPRGGFVGERAEVEAIIAALRAALTTPPARSYADGVADCAAIVSAKWEAEDDASAFLALDAALAEIRLLSQEAKA